MQPKAIDTSIFTTNGKPLVNPYLQPAPAPAPAKSSKPNGYFWKGANGLVYVQGGQGINSAGKWDANTAAYWSSKGFVQTPDSPTQSKVLGDSTVATSSTTPAKVLDTAQLQSLDSLINNLDTVKGQTIARHAITRDSALNEKKRERENEDSKYQGKKLTTLQDFSAAKTDTDLNTTSTLENLMSSLSTLGLGGGRALTRQILDAANQANRKANATQAQNNQSLDTAWNDYAAGNDNDVKKINDQYGFNVGEANRDYYQKKQDALYKKADVYNAADKTGERQNIMNEADSLNGLISGAAFMNPSYNGETKTMATPSLGDYTKDIAKYTTALDQGDGITPVGTGTTVTDGTGAGNLAVKAIAVNDKDLGVKKKTEGDLGFGV